MQMTVANLKEALEQFLAGGMLSPECIVGFAPPGQDKEGDLKVYPIDSENLIIVGCAPGCPPMIVLTGISTELMNLSLLVCGLDATSTHV